MHEAVIRTYTRSGRVAAGFAYVASFPKTGVLFAVLAITRLAIPVLAIGGDKFLGNALGAQAKLVAADVTVVVLNDTGYWILEENARTKHSQHSPASCNEGAVSGEATVRARTRRSR